MLNRALQRELLIKLSTSYPEGLSAEELGFQPSDMQLVRELAYLGEHQLVKPVMARTLSEPMAAVHATITANGLDFLAEDGGLRAILATVTVRLDAETLRALLLAQVEHADAPPEQKSRLKALLQDVATDGLKDATKALLELAWRRAPDAIQLLETALRSQG
jgi:hypothetical protein